VTVEEYGFQQAGYRRVLSFLPAFASYIAVAAKLGHFPTAVEYAETLGINERTAWRHRARIRRVLSEDEFRAVVMAAAGRMRNGQDPLSVELPAELLRRSA
jgi:hypothetical protein